MIKKGCMGLFVFTCVCLLLNEKHYEWMLLISIALGVILLSLSFSSMQEVQNGIWYNSKENLDQRQKDVAIYFWFSLPLIMLPMYVFQ